jgi:hypothetical protein
MSMRRQGFFDRVWRPPFHVLGAFSMEDFRSTIERALGVEV